MPSILWDRSAATQLPHRHLSLPIKLPPLHGKKAQDHSDQQATQQMKTH
jgi:hypothetical protein